MKPLPRSAVLLSAAVLVCASAASLATLLWRGSFPALRTVSTGNSVLAEARGWSAATLLVAMPMSCIALWAACRGSLRGRLAWIGGLAYFVYTYLEFAVSPPFTALYLVYVTAFACAIPALVIGVVSVDLAQVRRAFGDRAPRRSVAISSLLVAALLAGAWLSGIASRTMAGTFGWPVGEGAVQHVVHALDLGLQVPLGIATGVMLLRRSKAGLLVAAVMLVNWVCMGAALAGMAAWASADSGASAWSVAPFATFWGIGVVLAVAFFRVPFPRDARCDGQGASCARPPDDQAVCRPGE